MNTTTAQNGRLAFWQTQMTAWKPSGLSGAKFCQANDLNYSRFVYWCQKIHTSVLLAPNMADRYYKEVSNLISALNQENDRAEAATLIRSLVEKVILTSKPDDTEYNI